MGCNLLLSDVFAMNHTFTVVMLQNCLNFSFLHFSSMQYNCKMQSRAANSDTILENVLYIYVSINAVQEASQKKIAK
jgi:hypothetical protein